MKMMKMMLVVMVSLVAVGCQTIAGGTRTDYVDSGERVSVPNDIETVAVSQHPKRCKKFGQEGCYSMEFIMVKYTKSLAQLVEGDKPNAGMNVYKKFKDGEARPAEAECGFFYFWMKPGWRDRYTGIGHPFELMSETQFDNTGKGFYGNPVTAVKRGSTPLPQVIENPYPNWKPYVFLIRPGPTGGGLLMPRKEVALEIRMFAYKPCDQTVWPRPGQVLFLTDGDFKEIAKKEYSIGPVIILPKDTDLSEVHIPN